MKVTWHDKEITNPVLRGLVVTMGMTMLVLVVGLTLTTWPIWLPMDWLLRHSGRAGFLRFHDDGKFSIIFDGTSFRKVW